MAGDDLGDLRLRAVGGPARGDVADVLVGVRVADHHLLLVPHAAQRRAVDRLAQQRVHRRRGTREGGAGLEQRHDPQLRALAPDPREARLLHQQEHLEQVARSLRERDYVPADRPAVGAREDRAEHAKDLDRPPRGGRELADVGRDQRPLIEDVAAQQLQTLVFGERLVGVATAEPAIDLCERLAVRAHVLADIEGGEVEAEDLDLADHVAQVALGRVHAGPLEQRPLDQAQILEELARVPVGALGERGRGPDPFAHEGQRPAVRLFGIQLGQLGRHFGEQLAAAGEDRLEIRGRPDDPLGQRQAARQQGDPGLEEAHAVFAHQLERFDRRVRRHERVAVAIASDPRAEAQEGGNVEVLAGIHLREGLLEVAIDARNRVGERRRERDEAAAHLVLNGQRDRSQLI